MHDGMQYDPIEGQGQGHEPFKVGNRAIFKSYLLPPSGVQKDRHTTVEADDWTAFAHRHQNVLVSRASI